MVNHDQGETHWTTTPGPSSSPSLWQFLAFCKHSLWAAFSGSLEKSSKSNVVSQAWKASERSVADGYSVLKEKSITELMKVNHERQADS